MWALTSRGQWGRFSCSSFPSFCFLFCSAGQARMGICWGPLTFFWLLSGLEAPRIWRNEMCLWTAVHLLTACDGL